MITKPADALTGTRYVIEGSKEIADEEIGAPDGTTFLVRDLFYNTPARRKFLKTAQTEGTYISDMLEKLALSHPDISFKYINNNQTRLHTSGNGKKRDLIYHIYGREIAAALLEVNYKGEYFSLSGYIGKPVINRGNRTGSGCAAGSTCAPAGRFRGAYQSWAALYCGNFWNFNRRTENYQYDASGSGIFCECGMYSDSHDFRMPQCDHVKPVYVCPWISAFAGV